jgi:hypothetical protein
VTGPRAPVPGARLGIAVAVRALPTRADRDRYYCEFVAELYGLPASDQFRHTAGVLTQAFALRAALGGTSTRSEEAVMASTTAGQRFRCRYMHWHHWKTVSTPDGQRYVACAICNKEHDNWGGPPGAAVGMMGGGGGMPG